MEYMGSASYWNRKFRNRGAEMLAAEGLLLHDAEAFGFHGCGLEIGCGDGRNVIPLAQKGCVMTGLDFSEAALERLNGYAKDCGVQVTACWRDLSETDCFCGLPMFQFIVINHYRLCPDFYENLMQHLEQGGYLWVNGFCEVPDSNPDITETDLLTDCDFASIWALLVDRKRYEESGKQFVRYCFQKR